MSNHLVFGVLALLLILGAPLIADERPEAALDYLRIKYTRDTEQRIVSVELPHSSRDYHLEAFLDEPQLVRTIKEIKAPGCRASFARVKEFENLPELATVYFDGAKDANDYVACLRGVRNLKKLSLVGSSLTNHGLYDLCTGLPSLVELDLSNTKIDSMGLAPLAKLERLETLRLGRVWQGMSPPGSTQEEQAEDRRGFRYIANLPSLKRVTVEELDVTNEDLQALACNCHLEVLNVEGRHSMKADLATLLYLQECQPSIRLGPHIARSLLVDEASHDGWIHSIRNCTQGQFMRIPKPQLVTVKANRRSECDRCSEVERARV